MLICFSQNKTKVCGGETHNIDPVTVVLVKFSGMEQMVTSLTLRATGSFDSGMKLGDCSCSRQNQVAGLLTNNQQCRCIRMI